MQIEAHRSFKFAEENSAVLQLQTWVNETSASFFPEILNV